MAGGGRTPQLQLEHRTQIRGCAGRNHPAAMHLREIPANRSTTQGSGVTPGSQLRPLRMAALMCVVVPSQGGGLVLCC